MTLVSRLLKRLSRDGRKRMRNALHEGSFPGYSAVAVNNARRKLLLELLKFGAAFTAVNKAWADRAATRNPAIDVITNGSTTECNFNDVLRNAHLSRARIVTTSDSQTICTALNQRIIYVDNIEDMQSLDPRRLLNGQQFSVKSYHAGRAIGGGIFFWDAESAERADQGTIFGSYALGRFKRVVAGPLCATDFGAIPGDKPSGSDAFSRMPPGEYLIRHDIHTFDVTWAGDGYAVSTMADRTITVDDGHGLFSINGNCTKVGYINLIGRLEVGGKSADNRVVGVYVGVANIENYSASPAFRAQWASEIKVEHVEAHLLGDGRGNQGIAFGVLKSPDLGFFRVTGNISLGYQFVGNSTVNEPTIDGGSIGTLIADKDDRYRGVVNGHHGCYLKGCRGLVVSKIEVHGNGSHGWKSDGEYHIKLRDNQMCVFNALYTHDSADGHGLGKIFITSDGNTLPPMIENHDNLYNNVFGYTDAYATSPGVNRDCTIHNVKGAFEISSKNISGWLVTGKYYFLSTSSKKIFNNFEFKDCVIDAPSFNQGAYFARHVKARNCTFLQKIKTYNASIYYLNFCRVVGDIELDSSYGRYECNISNSSATGNLITHTYGERSVTAHITNTHFDNNESPKIYRPTIKNYRCVSFGSRVYLNEKITTDDLSAQ